MDQKTNQLSVTEDRVDKFVMTGDEIYAAREYVQQLENNVAHLKEANLLLEGQKINLQKKLNQMMIENINLKQLIMSYDPTMFYDPTNG